MKGSHSIAHQLMKEMCCAFLIDDRSTIIGQLSRKYHMAVRDLLAEGRPGTLPSLAETIVLDIINSNQPITAYQIRKQFIQTTRRKFSYGTLFPMLHQFEKSKFAQRVPKNLDEPISYNWFLTNGGIGELEFRLASHLKMLNAISPFLTTRVNENAVPDEIEKTKLIDLMDSPVQSEFAF
jgi:DNA-binding PadR family transcriptional regulator